MGEVRGNPIVNIVDVFNFHLCGSDLLGREIVVMLWVHALIL